MQKLRQARSRTGNNPIDITLSELDKRILGIIGHDYVQGLTTVPDSFPEEHNICETFFLLYAKHVLFFYKQCSFLSIQFNIFISLQNAIEELAVGNAESLNIPPAPIIIPEIDDITSKYFSYILVNVIIHIKINIYVMKPCIV